MRTPDNVLEVLLDARPRFLAFLRRRGLDLDAADEVLQGALAQVFERRARPRDPKAVRAWFLRVLRNRLTDLRRTELARGRREFATARGDSSGSPAPSKRSCGCVAAALSELKPEYRVVLQAVEVDGRSLSELAPELGVSANAATVRLHRARKALAHRLRLVCAECAARGNCQQACTCRGSRKGAGRAGV